MKSIIKIGCIGLSMLTTFSPLHADEDPLVQNLVNTYTRLITQNAENRQDSLLTDLMKIEKERFVSDQNVEELFQKCPITHQKIDEYLAGLNEDGAWKDINYQDTKRSGWEPKMHGRRILEMAKYYKSASIDAPRKAVVLAAIHRALNFWFTTSPVCKNWWYNQIGLPKNLGEAFVLLKDELTPKEMEGAVKVMSQSRLGMTGQNKVWQAGNVLIKGLLTEDRRLIETARDQIFEEITLGRNEGIKPDWSFHQHGPQQQFGNYGLSFLNSMSFYAALFQDTPLKINEKQKQILSSFVNEGYRWVIWNRQMDINSLNRQLFHNAQIHKGYLTAFAAQNLGLTGFPLKGNPLTGHKHFYCSDYTLHRRPQWMASLKMSSSRVIGTELVNEDNLKGFYTGDGATYFYVDGKEYLNIFPLWDWRKIPGVTAFEDKTPMGLVMKKKRRNNSPQVGGITCDGKGMSAMALNRDGLKAKKAWIFTDDFVLCLGAGISTDSALVVTTSIDQRLQEGNLLHWEKRKWEITTHSAGRTTAAERYYHDKTGYILLDGGQYSALTENRKGNWKEIMGMYKDFVSEDDVMSIHISHGLSPKGATYAYMVLPNSSKKSVAKFPLKQIRILKNDDSCQLVNFKSEKDIYWATVYRPNYDTLIDGKTWKAARPGIYCLKKTRKGFTTLQQHIF